MEWKNKYVVPWRALGIGATLIIVGAILLSLSTLFGVALVMFGVLAMLMTSVLKDTMKRKGWYAKEVDFIALNKECLWNTDSLYA
jgi:hypothetical protein